MTQEVMRCSAVGIQLLPSRARVALVLLVLEGREEVIQAGGRRLDWRRGGEWRDG